jgi:flagellar motor protein MotB
MNRKSLLWLGAALLCVQAGAQGTAEAPLGEAVERQLPGDRTFTPWARDPALLGQESGDRMEKRVVAAQVMETVKLKDVVEPVRFESGVADLGADDVEKIRRAMDTVRDKDNVRLHLVGHADNQRLSGQLAERYGDNAGLSRERAGQVAELLQKALALPPEAISYEWAGDTKPVAGNETPAGRARNRRVEVEVWYDVPQTRLVEQEVLAQEQSKQIKVCRVQTLCKMSFREGEERRTRVKNLVPALRYSEEGVEVTPEFIEHVRKGFENLRDKPNVVAKFIGYADDAKLSGRNERIYGDAVALSKARAHRVALAVQEALKLPAAAVASDGRGATTFVAANDTAQGRALNRRIEVQFWHDDPLQELPEEPQVCPDDGTSEVVTKVYIPSWGGIEPLQLKDGAPVVPAGYTERLRRAMADIQGRDNVRLRFVGYTGNQRLDRRTAAVYGDDIGLSAARARRAMEAVRGEMQLAPSQAEHEGRGYVQSADVVNEGFTQGEDSYVVVQVVYDEPAINDDLEGVDITRLTHELRPQNAYGLNLMHITVDGKPIDDPARSSADVQRCTDVELEKAHIQFQFDGLAAKPRLAVAATPEVAVAEPVRFRMYSNFAAFITEAEVRIHEAGQSQQAEPLAVVKLDKDGAGEWVPDSAGLPAAGRELQYVLRAHGANGSFDDTTPRKLWLFAEAPAAGAAPPAGEAAEAAEAQAPEAGAPAADAPPAAAAATPAEVPAAYGESALARHNIDLPANTIAVRGSGIPAGHTVWVAGRQVPVDERGNFTAEEILPDGLHTVEVSVLDQEGSGRLYLRDLELTQRERFYVGIADLTVSENRTRGPAELLQGAEARDIDSRFDGRLAFYATEKFDGDWRLTASADTREGPVKDLFSNFLDKAPDSLFRRIDPDYHYPTFGDDGIVEEMAPTLGKLYLKAEHGNDHLLWGSFKTSYAGNELAQVDRGLYGANLLWQADATTSFGEKRAGLDAFAAEPGTVAGRDEFRGTGGSLFYLRNQDILTGSERLRIELRDKDSGLVTGVVELRPTLDYDIDYLQGRILLAEPLSSIGADGMLVRSSGVSGDEAWLVARYEFTPGFDEINTLSTGGQGHYWFNDHVRVGLTASNSNEDAGDTGVLGADLTLRKSADSWLKLQGGRSEGLASQSLYSTDGGYGFTGYDPAAFSNARADGYRADVSVGLGDFISGSKGRVSLYTQHQQAGYSAPGLATLSDRDYYGGSFDLPLGERFNIAGKGDRRQQDLGLTSTALELDMKYQLTPQWHIASGVRNDERSDGSAVVPLTQQQGERTDGVLRVGYDSPGAWRAYGYGQQTLSKSGEREDNGRVGVGGSFRVGQKLRLDAEVSGGDLGAGARLGTNYMVSDRTSLYLNYALENERADTGLAGRRGNLVSGVKRRLSDSSSVYVEERYQDASQAWGLTHAAGMTLKLRERWNLGASAEVGTLVDSESGAETDRKAGGLRLGYALNSVQVSSGVEYRADDSQMPDLTKVERTTWLLRNNFKYQVTQDWRLVGKFDYSKSESSQGQFYDGGYTEAVAGFGYRPVLSDRLDVLAKYTWFYNVPTTGQVTLQGTAAQFIQKSHIGSVDVTYDLGKYVSVGGKYAYRLGAVSMDREERQFFDNRAQLVVVRTDLRFAGNWEGVVEARMLDMPDLDETRAGALLGVFRRVGPNVKVGLGYNFTDFSDDLTDLDYRHQGAFLNIVGAL